MCFGFGGFILKIIHIKLSAFASRLALLLSLLSRQTRTVVLIGVRGYMPGNAGRKLNVHLL